MFSDDVAARSRRAARFHILRGPGISQYDVVDQRPHVPIVVWGGQAHLLRPHVPEHVEEDDVRLPELVEGITGHLLLLIGHFTSMFRVEESRSREVEKKTANGKDESSARKAPVGHETASR